MQKIPGDIIQMIVIICLFILLIIVSIIVFIVIYQKRHKKYIEEKANLESTFQQTLLQAQLEIQEQTLLNISQEVHDNIGQVLSLAKIYLGTMYTASPDQLQVKLDDTRNLVGKAIQDLRDLSKILHTGYVTEMGLLRSIEYELDMVQKTGTLDAQLEVTGTAFKLDPRKELILFRIVQEVLNNIIKHAEATTLLVNIHYQPTSFSVTLTDNGKGFDLTPLNTNENTKFGLGLRNMQNRAHLTGAEFSISSTLGTGTTVTLFLPL